MFEDIARKSACGALNLECLRALPLEDILPLLSEDADLPEPMSWLVDKSYQRPDIPLMIGVNAGDAKSESPLALNATPADLAAWMRHEWPGVHSTVRSTYEQSFGRHWLLHDPVVSGMNTSYQLGMSAYLDEAFVCPTFEAAAVLQDYGIDVYAYFFNKPPSSKFLLCDGVDCSRIGSDFNFQSVGSCHGCDIPFWFLNSQRLTDDEMSVALSMTRHLSAFIHQGAPQTEWVRAYDGQKYQSSAESWLHNGLAPVPLVADVMVFGDVVEPRAVKLHDAFHCDMWEQWRHQDRLRDAWQDAAYKHLVAGLLVFQVAYSCCIWCSCTLIKWRDLSSTSGHASEVQTSLGVCDSVLYGPVEEYPETDTVSELFLRQVGASPRSIALESVSEDGGERMSITFEALLIHIVDATDTLNTLGAQGTIVPVMMERSWGFVVAVMAVLKSGAAWTALDVHAPVERCCMLCKQVLATLIVMQPGVTLFASTFSSVTINLDGSLSDVSLPEGIAKSRLLGSVQNDLTPESTAMVVFTSGSTGEPKGVLYSHRMLTHGVWFFGRFVAMEPGQRTLFKSPAVWAVVEYELFPPLIFGATLFLAKPHGHKQAAYLAGLIQREHIASLMITPRVLQHVLQHLPNLPKHLKHCVCIGEALHSDVVTEFRDKFGTDCFIHNMYGPSEASCTVWTAPFTRSWTGGNVPAGQPQPHVQVWLMRKCISNSGSGVQWQCVKAGEEGQIFLGGVMSSGYLGKPEVTASKFVHVPGVHGRLYDTGDLGKIVAGCLQVLGRVDRQLNISGVRIEPGEVEAALRQVVGEAVVLAAGQPEQLVAACVAKKDGPQEAATCLDDCAKRLPEYMIPKTILWFDCIPCLPNGKVDHTKLHSEVETRLLQLFGDGGFAMADSMGVLRHMSKETIHWQRATWICYVFWSLGVVLDHWLQCSPHDQGCAVVSYLVRPWVELILQSVGNVQDVCGFVILGALQDASNSDGVALGLRELAVWGVNLATVFWIPVVDMLTPWQPGYPALAASNIHRWYLWMYLVARLALWLFSRARLRPAVQVFLVLTAAYVCPASGFLDCCQSENALRVFEPVAFVLFPSYCQTGAENLAASALHKIKVKGCSCAVTGKTELVYVALYIAAFHLAPILKKRLQQQGMPLAATTLTSSLLLVMRYHVPSLKTMYGSLFSLATLFAVWYLANWSSKIPSSMLLTTMCISQLTVSQYFYALDTLEKGSLSLQSPIELFVSCCQPLLFLLAALQIVPLGGKEQMGWFMKAMQMGGSAALGTYIFHFYFTPSAQTLIQNGCRVLNASFGRFAGMWQIAWTLSLVIFFIFGVGPVCQAVLILPIQMIAKLGSVCHFCKG